MYRIDTPNAVASLATPAALGVEAFFGNGVAGGADGTKVDADWLNMLQESLIHLIDAASLAHSKTDYSQLTAAIAFQIATEAPVPPAATTSVAGIAELATDAEFAAGLDTTRAVTPANLASMMNNDAAGGYMTWPTRGGVAWRFQWMLNQNGSDGDLFTLPAAFDTANWNLWCGGLEDNSAGEADVRGLVASATQFNLDIDTAENPLDFCAFAIGEAP